MLKRFQRHTRPEQASADPTALIELRDVGKTFHNAAEDYTALRGINAAFRPGEFVSIVGRSGSGKSTLLNMMTGIDHPSTGFVRVGDAILHTLDEGRLSVWRGSTLGIVFQFFQLLPMLTLLENVMLPMDFCNLFDPVEREPRALGLLELVGLKGFENKYPAAVSGGQQQTAAVARALANDPPILVADEPTGNLDSKTAEMVLGIFEDQARAGKTILMVTHDITLARRARRVLVISDGELIPEAISNALPDLPHDVYLELARAARARRLAPGEAVLPGSDFPALVFVSGGQVGAYAQGLWNTRSLAQQLGPGGFFSSEDWRALNRAFAGLWAETPADVMVIDHLPDSPELKQALTSAAREKAPLFLKASRRKGEKKP